MKGILDAKGRDPLERYYTPYSVVKHHIGLLPRVVRRNDVVCSPFAGDGRYGAAAGGDLVMGDIDPRDELVAKAPWDKTVGRAVRRAALLSQFLHVIENPAFSQAEKVVRHCAAAAERDLPHGMQLSLLVPASFLEPTGSTRDYCKGRGREHLFAHLPPQRIVFAGRIQFEGPAIEARREEGRKVGKAAMQYAYVTWLLGGPWHGTACQTRWSKAPATGQRARQDAVKTLEPT